MSLPDQPTPAGSTAADAQLEQRRQLLYTLVQHLPGGAAFVVDSQLRYQLAEGEALDELGMKPGDFVGKTIFEALGADTAARYEPQLRQALAGEAFTDEHQVSGRYFQSKGVPMRDASGNVDAVMVLSYDITSGKKEEEALRQGDERKALLLRISDTLRTITDPVAIQQTAMRMLSEHIGLSRAYFFEVEREGDSFVHVIENVYQRDPDGPNMIGRHPLANYGTGLFEGLDLGKVVAVPDVAAAPGLSAEQRAIFRTIHIAAFINVPLLRNDAYSAGVAAHDTVPHPWTADEISLIGEVASRMWTSVERARAEAALRASEERTRIQKEAFQLAIDGEPLASSLNALTRIAKAQLGSDVRTAFYMAYHDGTSLHAIEGAGDMPQTYAAAADRFPVGETSFCSGYTIATGRPALTRDVMEDPLWQPYRHLAAAHNFRSSNS